MQLIENIRLALRAIRSNLLRTILTVTIIAFGIMALVGILTAIDGINSSLSNSLASMGANTYNVVRKGDGIGGGGNRRNRKRGPVISYEQAVEFKDRYDFPAKVSISEMGTSMGTVKHKDEKSNPNIVVMGIDENYLDVAGYTLESGRNINFEEAYGGRSVALIGQDVTKKIFPDKELDEILESVISVNNIKYKIVGVLAKKGSSGSFAGDRNVLIPLYNLKRQFALQNNSYNLSVGVNNTLDIDAAIDEGIGIFRAVRGLKLAEENDFEMTKSDGLFSLVQENTAYIRVATIVIGIITLLSAAIGLMNIMLVSVTERTREIGITKALGATRRNILIQFLTEAVVICQLGGLLGILFGVLAGLGVTVFLKGTFVIPWAWIFLGITVCLIVGLLSGLYPALKAARLDPIESLRYE